MKQKNIILTATLIVGTIVLIVGVLAFVRNNNGSANTIDQSMIELDKSLTGINGSTDFPDIKESELEYEDAAQTSSNQQTVDDSYASMDLFIKGLNPNTDFTDFEDLQY